MKTGMGNSRDEIFLVSARCVDLGSSFAARLERHGW